MTASTRDPRMSDVETLLWGLERLSPRFRSVITVIGVFDRAPRFEAVTQRFERLTRLVPRLRERVVPGPVIWSAPRWEPDPDFELAYHLRRVKVAGEGSLDDLLRLAEPLASESFDFARPLWQAVLVEGMADDGFGLVFKLHHTFTDGLGLVELATHLFDFDRHAPDDPLLPGIDLFFPLSPLGRLRDEVAHEMRRTGDLTRRAIPLLFSGVAGMIKAPENRARETVDYIRSAGHVAIPSSTPLSPVMTGRSLGVHLRIINFPLEGARRAGRETGGTVNDVYVSGVLEGLRLYHARHGSAPPALRVGVPVSRRPRTPPPSGGTTSGNGAGNGAVVDEATVTGNHLVPLRFQAPLQVQDRRSRIKVFHDLILEERSQPALDLLVGAAGVANRLPMAHLAVASVLASVDVMVSNVPGSPVPLYLGGARVTQLIPFGPRSGAGLNVTALSYADRFSVGVNADPAATPDADLLVECLRQGIEATIGKS